MSALREDLGPPIAALGVEDGTPVYDSEGQRIGVVDRVLFAGGIFEGVVVHSHPLPGRHLYADAEQIAELHERGVVLAVPRSELRPLRDVGPRRVRPGSPAFRLETRLRRLWDWLTGWR